MTIKKISPEALYEKMEKEQIVLLDVRAKDKYKNDHITGKNVKNVNIPKTHIFDLKEGEGDDLLQALPKGKELIVTCTTGNSAAKCASILEKKDYDVTVLDGGVTAWKEWIHKK